MLNAHAIYRFLLENELPATPAVPDIDAPSADTKADVQRLTDRPLSVPGVGPTDTYARIRRTLAGRAKRKIGNNTYAVDHGDRLAILLHQTDVITAYPDGRVVVETGGWHPGGGQHGWKRPPGATTRDRITEWLPSSWSICSIGGLWYWYNCGNGRGAYEDDLRYPFSRGDTITPDGYLHVQAQTLSTKSAKKRKL